MGYSIIDHVDRNEIPDLVKYRDGEGVDVFQNAKLRSIQKEVGNTYMTMKAHPNYQDPMPIKGESQISFILRSIAHLISPPQDPGESYDLECVDIAASILAMKDELELIWSQHNSK